MSKSFIQDVEAHASQLLDKKGFRKIFDSNNVPHEKKKDLTHHVIYSDGKRNLKISERDWRDFYYIHYLEMDGKELIEVDYTGNIKGAIETLVGTIKNIQAEE